MTFLSTFHKGSIHLRAVLSFVVALLLAIALLPVASPFDQEAEAELKKGESSENQCASRDSTLLNNDIVRNSLFSGFSSSMQQKFNAVTENRHVTNASSEELKVDYKNNNFDSGSSMEESFKLQFKVTEENLTFSIPVSSALGNISVSKPYDWYIDWGDGTNQNATGVSHPSYNGIPHTYDTADVYTITIAPKNPNQDAWLGAFGFYNIQDGASIKRNKELVVAAIGPLTPNMTRTAEQLANKTAPTNEWAYMFYGCTNLKQAPSIEGWDEVTSVNSSFAREMFRDCLNLEIFSDDFNLPQSIEEINGGYFAYCMFVNCASLTVLPKNFNLPQNIIVAGDRFAAFMFQECSKLENLPDKFNFPQGLESIGADFAHSMFHSSGLISLPDDFSFPRDIKTVGNNFAFQMFHSCNNLASLPDDFSFPQSLETVGNSFARTMFHSCTGLTTLPDNINLPQEIKGGGTSFAEQMFYNAGDSNFQINETFVFPEGKLVATSSGNRNFSQALILSSEAPLQKRNAKDIIGKCSDPNSARETFRLSGGTSKFKDIAGIHENWGGDGLAEYFQLEVTTVANDTTFYLPTSSQLEGIDNVKPYEWNVYWGDRGIEHVDGYSDSTSNGIEHKYENPGIYTITITPNDPEEEEVWLGAFGFTTNTLGANKVSNKELISAVLGPLKPSMTRRSDESPPDYEWANMFNRCTNLRQVPSIEEWEEVSEVGGYFAVSMFQNCTNLETLSGNFNFPQAITAVGTYFASSMFQGCKNLESLHEEFNLPQDIINITDGFASSMFQDCVNLSGLPDEFNFPQKITEVDEIFAWRMFYRAGSSKFQINKSFTFPEGTSTKSISYYEALALSDEAPMQQRTAKDIIGKCATPPDARHTFRALDSNTSKFTDIRIVHENWGGYGVEYFQIKVTTEAPDTIFYLPTSSALSGAGSKAYDWIVYWENGEEGHLVQGNAGNNAGIAHKYENSGIHTITIAPRVLTEGAWFRAFGFSASDQGSNTAENKALVTAAAGPLKPSMTRTEEQLATGAAPHYEWAYMFQDCINLKEAPSMEGWDNVTKAGNFFAFQMFFNCTSLTNFPDEFNFPQNITNTGSSFAASTFYNCTSLTILPPKFNLPQKISATGVYFSYELFANCTSLDFLPMAFNLPQGIEELSNEFAFHMFYNAGSSGFQMNDEFVLPEGTSEGRGYYYQTFVLSDQAPMQDRTAASIIGENKNPSTYRWTFRADEGVSKFSDIAEIHKRWGGFAMEPGAIEVTLDVDQTFHKNQVFVIELSNNDGIVNRKQLLVQAGSDNASFIVSVQPDTYTVKMISEGSAWRYSPDGEPLIVTIDEGEEKTATVKARQVTSKWLSDSTFALNRVAESFP